MPFSVWPIVSFQKKLRKNKKAERGMARCNEIVLMECFPQPLERKCGPETSFEFLMSIVLEKVHKEVPAVLVLTPISLNILDKSPLIFCCPRY